MIRSIPFEPDIVKVALECLQSLNAFKDKEGPDGLSLE